VTHARTWASDSTVYQFGSLSLVSTYKTILHYYVVIITDLIRRTHMSRLHTLNSVNNGQGLVVNVLGSAANVLQNYPDMGVCCYTAHEKMH